MQNRPNPLQNFIPGYLPTPFPAPTPAPFLPSPYTVASIPGGCLLPQQDFCQMYVRLPYAPYPQQYTTYPTLPISNPDLYRLVTPTGVYPYQGVPLPAAGYAIPRAPLIPNHPMRNTEVPTTSRLATTITLCGNPSQPSTSIARNSGLYANVTHNKSKTANSRSRNCPNSSKNRPRYGTSFRRNMSRKNASKGKHSFHDRSPTPNAVELSSIARIDAKEGDDYETCDEKEIVGPADDYEPLPDCDWFHDTRPVVEAPVPPMQREQDAENKSMEYTLITNDKSYSHVNFNPNLLPGRLDRIWLQMGTPSPTFSEQNRGQTRRQSGSTSSRKVAEDVSVMHLSEDGVYYVMKPNKNPICHQLLTTDKVAADDQASPSNFSEKECCECQHSVKSSQCCCSNCFKKRNGDLTHDQTMFAEISHYWDDSKQDVNNNEQLDVVPNDVSLHVTNQDSAPTNQMQVLGANPLNKLISQSRELWWDNSADISCESGRKPALGENSLLQNGHAGNSHVQATESFSSVSQSESRNSSNEAVIQEVDDFVVVDTAPRKTRPTEQPIFDDIINNSKLCSNTTDPADNVADVIQGKKKLDVDWDTIRTLVPQEYLTRSFIEEGRSEVYDLGSSVAHHFHALSKENGPIVSRSECPLTKASSFYTIPHSGNLSSRRLCEEDQAIVAVFQVQEEETDAEEVETATKATNLEDTSANLLSLSTHSELNKKRVEAKRVIKSKAGSTPRTCWGKQDVRMYLLTSVAQTNGSPSTTWCPYSSSTPSMQQKDPACESSKDLREKISEKKVLNPRITDLALIGSAKSLPTSPMKSRELASMEKQKQRRSTSLQNIHNKTNEHVSIDCALFNISTSASSATTSNVSCSISRHVPVTAQDKTYLLTPASSELEMVASNASILLRDEKDQTRLSQKQGKPKSKRSPATVPADASNSRKSRRPLKRSNCMILPKARTKEDNFPERTGKLALSTSKRNAEMVSRTPQIHKATRYQPYTNRQGMQQSVQGTLPSKNGVSAPQSPISSLATVISSTGDGSADKLGPYGSKTIVKEKQPKLFSSRSKPRSARKSLANIPSDAAEEALKETGRRSEQSKAIGKSKSGERLSAKKAIPPDPKSQKDTIVSGNIKKYPKLRSVQAKPNVVSTSSNSSKIASNQLVSGSRSTRRSPRIARQSLSAADLIGVSEKAKKKRVTAMPKTKSHTQLSTIPQTSDGATEISHAKKSSIRSLAPTSDFIPKQATSSVSMVNVVSSVTTVTCSISSSSTFTKSVTECAPVPVKSFVAPVTPNILSRGKVQSSIKTIVHNLVSQTTSARACAISSPGLAALRTRNSYKSQTVSTENQRLFLQSISGSIRKSDLPKVSSKAKTAPPSPLRNESLANSQRSASLSDLFYDTTTEASVVWNTFVSWLEADDSTNKDLVSKTHQIEGTENQTKTGQVLQATPLTALTPLDHVEKTYVAFSPPTMTPPNAKQCSAREDFTRVATKESNTKTATIKKSSVLECSHTKMAPKPPKTDIQNDTNLPQTFSDVPIDSEVSCKEMNSFGQTLDQKTEEEIRKSVLLLVESVLQNSQAQINQSSSSAKGTDERAYEIANSDNKQLRPSSFDIATQTTTDALIGNTLSQAGSEQVTAKLSVPPKKPPRSNSPSARAAASAEALKSKEYPPRKKEATSNTGTCTNVAEKQLSSQTTEVTASPVIPYYPLFTALPGFSPHRHPHYLSPTLMPVSFPQPFFTATNSAFVWPTNTQPVAESSDDSSKLLSTSKVSSSRISDSGCDQTHPLSSQVQEVRAAAFLTSQPHLAVAVEDHIKIQRSLNGLPATVNHSSAQAVPSLMYHPQYPHKPRPKWIPEKRPIGVRRRRSFSGIGSPSVKHHRIRSSDVARVRLYRRLANQVKRPSALKIRSQQEFNMSHPVGKEIVRRQRFVRSSLSEDTVFEAVKANPPVFITKPAKVKTSDTSSPVKSSVMQLAKSAHTSDATINNHKEDPGIETDSISECTSSGKTTPDNAVPLKKVQSDLLQTIPEDKQQAIVFKKKTHARAQAKEKLPEISTVSPQSKVTQDHKKHHIFSLKHIKRYMSHKKPGKHDGGPSHPESSNLTRPILSGCKTDTKLLSRREASQPSGRDHIRDMFRKTKKNITEKTDQAELNNLRATVRENTSATCEKDTEEGCHHPSNPSKSSPLRRPRASGVCESYDIKGEVENTLPGNILRQSNSESVSTPGVRINSETGDIMHDDKNRKHSAQDGHGLQKILSSTAIDEDSMDNLGLGVSITREAIHVKDDNSDMIKLGLYPKKTSLKSIAPKENCLAPTTESKPGPNVNQSTEI
ncbi:uncharacterized protein LOC143460816 isoform X2 [Clavelina lepadiformis]|uniref:uncharacterized protein LOC143460816 isoform X2 n=1 Tax=Clavelina lepadiformis TaxID=159417 RepID=UPI0040431879